MHTIRYYFKLFRSGLVVVQFLLLLSLIKRVMKKGLRRRSIVAYFTRYHSNRLAKVAGVHFEIKGKFPPNDTHLIVCNHLSYIDIVVLHAIFRKTCFIAAKDMMESKFLGPIIKNGNSYGIERRNRKYIEKDIKEMHRILNNGFDLLMFPEGKTSNGESVNRFKEPLFDSAIRAGKKVLPIALNYISIDGKPISMENRDTVYWYDDSLNLFKHFKNLCRTTKRIKIEIAIGSCLDTKGETSTSISLKAHDAVSKLYKTPSPTNPDNLVV